MAEFVKGARNRIARVYDNPFANALLKGAAIAAPASIAGYAVGQAVNDPFYYSGNEYSTEEISNWINEAARRKREAEEKILAGEMTLEDYYKQGMR